ncbi:unnamed protein product [Paramecium pentaurelia]|uniref:Peptidase S49 domain-containing protein n=1 Tax=Paramecium pentaurelia TaxID=43138 RepID=A0A8S1SSQ8_9CILI|nr:unnamed protein product [Paramecium pentaurelia]
MFSRIVQFKIYGKIDEKLTQKVYKSIQETKLIKPKLVTVHIHGEGSFVQSKCIATAIRNYSRSYKVPLYTFAEDFVMNSSVYLMTIGDKNFASEYSVIGDFGYVQRRLGYKQLMENLGIQHKFIHSGEKKVKLSPYDDLKEEDVKWIEGQLKHREQRLKDEIMQNRNQKVDQEMWNQTLLTGQQALKYGLIDKLGIFDDIREQEYKGMKTYDILSNLLDYYVPANATFSNYLSI